MSFRNLATAAVTVALAGTVGCASGLTNAPVDDEPAGRRTSTLNVTNNNWSDMTIYVVRSGVRARLGSVPAMSNRSFAVPQALVSGTSDVNILARPLASRQAFMSQRINVGPGQRIDLRLENNLRLSNFSVW